MAETNANAPEVQGTPGRARAPGEKGLAALPPSYSDEGDALPNEYLDEEEEERVPVAGRRIISPTTRNEALAEIKRWYASETVKLKCKRDAAVSQAKACYDQYKVGTGDGYWEPLHAREGAANKESDSKAEVQFNAMKAQLDTVTEELNAARAALVEANKENSTLRTEHNQKMTWIKQLEAQLIKAADDYQIVWHQANTEISGLRSHIFALENGQPNYYIIGDAPHGESDKMDDL